MDINELKKLVKNSTAVLVLDNGETSLGILNYDTYKDLVFQEPVREVKISKNHSAPTANGLNENQAKPALSQDGLNAEPEVLEKINKDILALKEEIEKEEKAIIVD